MSHTYFQLLVTHPAYQITRATHTLSDGGIEPSTQGNYSID